MTSPCYGIGSPTTPDPVPESLAWAAPPWLLTQSHHRRSQHAGPLWHRGGLGKRAARIPASQTSPSQFWAEQRNQCLASLSNKDPPLILNVLLLAIHSSSRPSAVIVGEVIVCWQLVNRPPTRSAHLLLCTKTPPLCRDSIQRHLGRDLAASQNNFRIPSPTSTHTR